MSIFVDAIIIFINGVINIFKKTVIETAIRAASKHQGDTNVVDNLYETTADVKLAQLAISQSAVTEPLLINHNSFITRHV